MIVGTVTMLVFNVHQQMWTNATSVGGPGVAVMLTVLTQLGVTDASAKKVLPAFRATLVTILMNVPDILA